MNLEAQARACSEALGCLLYDAPAGQERAARIIARHMTAHKSFALARFTHEAHIWLTEVGAPQGELPERMRWAAKKLAELEATIARLKDELAEHRA